MASGEVSTRPWPIIAAACSTPSSAGSIEPMKASSPAGASWPMPRVVAASASSAWETVSCCSSSAVLQECAITERSGMVPNREGSMESAFLKERPATEAVSGHCSSVSGVTPARSSDSAVTVLKVEPGAYWPTRPTG